MGVGNELANRPDKEARADLKAIACEASVALAHLDATRLEELAISCEALTSAPIEIREVMDAIEGMAVLGRVLEATRANAEVMQRLRVLRTERIEYSERQARGIALEALHGHD